MSLVLENPSLLAKEIAQLLDADPIMARQIKEHVKPERLLDLLEIDPMESFEVKIEEAEDNHGISELLETLLRKGVTLTQVIKAARLL